MGNWALGGQERHGPQASDVRVNTPPRDFDALWSGPCEGRRVQNCSKSWLAAGSPAAIDMSTGGTETVTVNEAWLTAAAQSGAGQSSWRWHCPGEADRHADDAERAWSGDGGSRCGTLGAGRGGDQPSGPTRPNGLLRNSAVARRLEGVASLKRES